MYFHTQGVPIRPCCNKFTNLQASLKFERGTMQMAAKLASEWLNALVSPREETDDLERASPAEAVCEIASSLIEKAREHAIQEFRLQAETRAALGRSNRTIKRLKVFGIMGLPNATSDMLLDEAIQRLEEVRANEGDARLVPILTGP